MNFNFKTPFPISAGHDPMMLVFLIGWLVYIAIYWACLWKILRATRFDTSDKILWFLVITMAPVLGIIAFVFLCPQSIRNQRGPNE